MNPYQESAAFLIIDGDGIALLIGWDMRKKKSDGLEHGVKITRILKTCEINPTCFLALSPKY